MKVNNINLQQSSDRKEEDEDGDDDESEESEGDSSEMESSESSISEASNQEEDRKAEENDIVADLNLTARNAGEDSQREIMLDPAKIDTSVKEKQTKNPKKL